MSIFQLQMWEDQKQELGEGEKEKGIVPPLNSSAP